MPIYKPSSRRSSKARTNEKSQTTQSQVLTLTITGLSDDGRGLADVDGKKIFVKGALPGETVDAFISQSHRRYSEAKVKTIHKPSQDRQQPLCPVFKHCGGCSVQYMPHEQQLTFKQQAVLSQLSRWAGLAPDTLLPPISQSSYHYRQRIRLSVDYARNDDLFMGFREEGSRRLVNIEHCAVLAESLDVLLPLLRQWLLELPPRRVSHIELVGTPTHSGVLVRHVRPLSLEQRQSLSKLLARQQDSQHPDITLWFQGGKKARDSMEDLALESVDGDTVDPRLHYALGDLSLSFHPQDFIQANARVNQSMVRQAMTLMAPQPHEHIVDLFCGMGNFSLPLATLAQRVTAVEGVASMVERGQANAYVNQINNLQFLARDLADEAAVGELTALGEIDGLLLDPPRSGAKIISQQIMKLNPKRIVYVSCDSATFARDAGILAGQGYRLVQLGVIDMFPQTPHIEVMGKFER